MVKAQFVSRALIGVFVLSLAGIVTSACNVGGARQERQSLATSVPNELTRTATLTSSALALTYTNATHHAAFSYPADWVKANEGDQSLVIVPRQEAGWQPNTPADAAKNPAVSVTFGALVRERLRQRNFPNEVNPRTFRVWIEASDSNAQSYTINGVEAFEVIERTVPGCERVVYWRPGDLDQLVRISTGCDSVYLAEFRGIVQSLRQVR